MQSNYSILFYIKKNEPKKSGLFSVMGRITINKRDSVFNTKVEVSGDDWNSIERGQNIRSAGAKVVKNRLDILRTKAQEYYWMLYEQGQEPDSDSIRNLLTGAKQAEETLLKLFDLQNEQMFVRVGVDLTKETYSRYVLIRERLAMYLKEKRHVEDISIRKVSLAFIQDFETYMRANFPVNTNMLYKYMQYFRRVVRNAFHSGLIRSYPFSEYKLRKTKAEIPYLTKDELLALMSKRFTIKRLEEIRDIFVFSCFTGLAYVDVKKLGKDEIQPFMDGRDWIITSRSKTGNAVNVKLFDIPRQIIRKYEGQTTRNYVLPVVTNQKTNAYLKEIATLCGIKKNLTFHMARHTFATTVILSNGISMEVLQRLLGHDDIRDTQIYGKIVDTRVAREIGNMDMQLQDYGNVFMNQNSDYKRVN